MHTCTLQSDVKHTRNLNVNRKIIRQIGLSKLIRRSHQFKKKKEKRAFCIIEAKSDGTYNSCTQNRSERDFLRPINFFEFKKKFNSNICWLICNLLEDKALDSKVSQSTIRPTHLTWELHNQFLSLGTKLSLLVLQLVVALSMSFHT